MGCVLVWIEVGMFWSFNKISFFISVPSDKEGSRWSHILSSEMSKIFGGFRFMRWISCCYCIKLYVYYVYQWSSELLGGFKGVP